MKLISFVVPCYNSAEYMRHCIDLLLTAGDSAEILIVDDGSTDETGRIADEYAARHPRMIRAFHQENGGHGEAVNTGLANAEGLYFKVVDSDDWLDAEAIRSYMDLLGNLRGAVDLLICNYVYEKQGKKHKKVMRYGRNCPKDRVFTWSERKPMRLGEGMTMHALTYRTHVLRECRLHLPKHTFYVDNLYAYIPLPYVKTLYYADIDLYRYFIGRSDQSVNESVMIKRQDQQLEVMRQMIQAFPVESISIDRLREYLIHNLEMLMAVTSIILIIDGSEQALLKKAAIWQALREGNGIAYRRIRYRFLGRLCAPSSKTALWMAKRVYRICQVIYGFN